MSFNFSKIAAWLIVVAGLAIIFWSVTSSTDFFMGKKDFPQVFKAPTPVAETVSQQPAASKTKTTAATALTAEALQQQMQESMQESIKQTMGDAISNMMPTDSVIKILNMSSWVAFASFLVFAGAQIAGVGAKILVNKA